MGPSDLGARFIADYDGPCGICEGLLKEGEEGVYVDDEPCHVECAEDES